MAGALPARALPGLPNPKKGDRERGAGKQGAAPLTPLFPLDPTDPKNLPVAMALVKSGWLWRQSEWGALGCRGGITKRRGTPRARMGPFRILQSSTEASYRVFLAAFWGLLQAHHRNHLAALSGSSPPPGVPGGIWGTALAAPQMGWDRTILQVPLDPF